MSSEKISGSQSSDQLTDAAELRRRAEARLAESEDKYKYIFDHSVVGKSITLPSGEINVNQAFCEMLGYTPEELQHKRWQEISHPDDVELTQKAVDSLLSGEKESQRFNKRYLHKSGAVVWADVSTSLRRDREGNPLYFMTALIDITERKRVDEALGASQEKLRLVLDATPFPIAVVDLQDNNILFWSRSALELFGHTALTAPEWYQIAYPDPVYRGEAIDRWKSVLEVARQSHSAVNTGEYRITCRDGSVRICELYAAFLAGNLIVTFNDITERKQAEDALHASEEKYRLIAESAEDWIYWLTPDQTLRYISPSCERVTGYAPAEFASNPYLLVEIVHPDDRKNVEEHFLAKNQDEAGSHELEFRIVMKTGEIRWISHTCKPVFDQGGEFAGRRGTNRNINARKQAQEALHISENKYRKLHESMMDGFVFVDMHGIILDRNETYQRMLGYSREELTRLTFVDLTPEKWHSYEQGIVDGQILLKGYSEVYEKEYRKKDGTIFPVELRAFLIQSDAGENEGIWAIVRDITDRKYAEEKIQNSEAFLNRIIEQSPLAMWISDSQGNLIRLNQACCDLLHITAKEVVGLYNIFQDNIVEEQGFMPLVKAVFEHGETVHFEIQYDSSQVKDLKLQHVVAVILEVTIFPIKDTYGRITHAIIQHNNITDRKQKEAQINEQINELRRWQAVTLGREDRILELKREMNELLVQAGKPPRYPSVQANNPSGENP